MGEKKQLPILIVPGIMSSGLEVVKSRNGDSYVGQRVWMNPTAIGFGAMYTGRAEETVLNEKNPKNLLKEKGGRFDAFNEAFSEGESDDDEEEHFEDPKGVSHDDIKEGIKCKSAWLDHLSLSDDMVNERVGNEIRPIAGLDGVDFLTEMATIKVGASYVFGPIIALLEAKGYTRQKDLDAAPYDWRIPPAVLEQRDGYFTKTLDRIEKMYKDSGDTPVVLLCHSMGCKCGHYLLTFALKHRGQAWLDQYVHSYMPVGGPHLGAPSTISMAFNPEMNPMLDPMLRNEERLIFGRSLGSGPWLMPRNLPTNVAAQPCLFYKEEGLMEITLKEPLGDCDTLIATEYGTREMDSLKLFIEYGNQETHSKATPIMDTLRTESKDAKYFKFNETFRFATPPTLEEGGLESFELVLKHQGNMRAYDLEKKNKVMTALKHMDRNRLGKVIFDAGHKKMNSYKTVIGRSTKQSIDVKKLSSSEGFELEMPVTIHARVDMTLSSCEPKHNSRQIQTTLHIKWTPPLSASPPSCTSAPLATFEKPKDGYKPPSLTIKSNSQRSAAVYQPVSGNTIFQAEGLDTALNLAESYEKDDLGPRTTSSVDAPPVKKVMAVYGINLPTQVSAVCCRRHIGRVGPGTGASSEFVMDKSAFLAGDANGYEIDDGAIRETSGTPQQDLLTGEIVHKSGDGTVPYYSLQQCQVWKKEGSCDVQIEEIDGGEHRAILADKRFHDFLLNYLMG